MGDSDPVSSYDAFADDYDVWAADMTQDVDWYVELGEAAREPIVELAVGSGRVAIDIARRTGKRVERAGGRWETVTNVPADSRIDVTRGRGLDRIGTLSLWWATRREWDGLIDVAGLELEGLYGGFHREPYDDDSLEQVWVARKPG